MSAARQQIVFLSRTTNGLADTALKCQAILEARGLNVIHQPGFTGSWRDVKGMLVDKLIECDAAICLIGPACGTMMREPVTGLRDERTAGRHFSYTQLEYLVARDLPRPVFTYLCSGGELIAPLTPESAEQEKSQRDFIEEFAKDGSNVRVSCDTFARLEDDLRRIVIPPTVSAGRPCNLPYATLGSLFKGREDFMENLRARLTSEAAAIIKGHAISGMGGVGKTRAAIEYAWRYAEDYRALLFVTADTPEALQRSLAALCGPLILNLPEQDAREQEIQINASLTWLRRHPGWFLIIDNADTEDALAAAGELVTQLSEGKCLITSRLTDYSGAITALDLDVLRDEDAAAFLTERTAGHRTLSADDPAKVLELAQLLDGLALALEQAAAYIRKTRTSFAEYITRWHTHTAEALKWHDAKKMHYPRSLAVTFETSVAQLSTGARELLRTLAWFAPDPVPFSIMESEHAPANARALLAELENLSLARRREDGSAFSLHRLVQEITRQQQPDTEKTETTRGGFLGLFRKMKTIPVPPPSLLAALFWVNAAMPQDTDDVRTWPVAVPLLPHALTTATAAADRDLPVPTTRLLSCAALLVETQANYRASEPLKRRALTLTEKHLGRDLTHVATCLNNLAQSLQATNRLAEAEPLMRRVVKIFEQSLGRDHPNVASALGNLACLLHARNRMAKAEPLMRRALALNEKHFGDSHPEVAKDLNNLAWLLHETNRLVEAEPLMRRVVKIFEQSRGRDHPNVATALNNLALLLQGTNRLAEAEPLHRRALAIDEAHFGDSHPDVAIRLNGLARLLQATNRLTEAEPLMRRMVGIFVHFNVHNGHPHPHFKAAVRNYKNLLSEMGRSEAQIEEVVGKIMGPIRNM